MTPWTDRSNRFSALKASIFAATLAPALWIAWRGATGGLGPRPLTEAIHDSGDWSVYFLLAALAISPLRQTGQFARVLQVRRMLGLAGLAYAMIHLVLYAADQGWVLGRIVHEIVNRFYLTIGVVALVGLVALGATSTDGAIRRMGPAWHRLHRLVYPITGLALFHYFLQSKIDVTLPVLLTGLFLLAMAWRVLRRQRLQGSGMALLAAAPVVAVVTALVEWAWYALATNLPADRILAANLAFEPTIRPAWWVLGAGIALALLGFARAPRKDSGRPAVEARV